MPFLRWDRRLLLYLPHDGKNIIKMYIKFFYNNDMDIHGVDFSNRARLSHYRDSRRWNATLPKAPRVEGVWRRQIDGVCDG